MKPDSKKPASELGRLLWERVNAAHQAIGAPFEDLADEVDLPLWTMFDLGNNGVLGIKYNADRDGDSLLVALPPNHARSGSKLTCQIMKAWTTSGRALYTAAWKGHHLAVNINKRMGGVAMGIDPDGFIHFKHTYETLPGVGHCGKKKHA